MTVVVTDMGSWKNMEISDDFKSTKPIVAENHSDSTGEDGLHSFVNSRRAPCQANQDLPIHFRMIQSFRLAEHGIVGRGGRCFRLSSGYQWV